MDDDLLWWEKHPANPILTEKLHGETKVWEWRDPFIFKLGERSFMLLSGHVNDSDGSHAW